MSDLIGGGPSTSAGNGRGGSSGSRAQAGAGTTGSPSIKGPRDIMRERNAREARRKAEQEALERERAEDEARLIEEERRKSAERRAAAAGVAGAAQRAGAGDQRTSGAAPRASENLPRSERRPGERIASGGDSGAARPQEPPLQGRGAGGRALGGGEQAAATSSRSRGPSQSQGQPRPVRGESSRPGAAPTAPPAGGPSTQPAGTPGPAQASRSSFPHAFERWETLSAHWEGLTSFWIRRLEENTNEINRDPLSQQLSRQVTDLSAAGANLFHAVVELQRLRASSERKFQRWFFETRSEQERAQEIQAVMEASLEEERRGRAAAIADAIAVERAKSNSEKMAAEMRRELQISKEEARRAWEELGRREQEERERTLSLRDGQPTLVGGVQVVPMMQGVPSRHGSARDPPPARQSPFSAAGGASGGGQAMRDPEGDSDEAYQPYARTHGAEPADPFVESGRTSASSRAPRTSTAAASTSAPSHPEYTQAPAVQPTSSGVVYQQQQRQGAVHPTTPTGPAETDPSYASPEGPFSEEEYEIDSQGHFIRDARGNKIRYQGVASDDDTDEYDVAADRERELAYLQRYGHAPISGVEYGQGPTATAGGPATPSSTTSATAPSAPAEYTGQGYGSGWEAVPRHHHPTRLSDVLEEDERSSRMSASQISRRE